ncbi:MAG: tryptophan-rich sensory protein [Bacteroidetes bacterium]|nr:tryptophan-rich sensory protein [Bacteroidota bacterium]
MAATKRLPTAWKFIIAIILCESVGIISGLLASANNNPWFDALNKPTWNPPAYLFGPVWTTLYLLMGISLGIIWNNNSTEPNKRKAYFLFALQLFLNFWWSIIFFHFHSPAFALLDIIIMVVIIIITIFTFSSFSKLAAWLLVPYISWVSFATILNFTIWNLNH